MKTTLTDQLQSYANEMSDAANVPYSHVQSVYLRQGADLLRQAAEKVGTLEGRVEYLILNRDALLERTTALYARGLLHGLAYALTFSAAIAVFLYAIGRLR